ncbi:MULTISPECIES: enoyl-CoA hydratase-related protein [unclassified Saccharopolyspora]|uniref:enoyl-CoA hydratase-related protein n=1 Tax=unclassified Saccharopolyspora TaxID=2646250 RepID=UPI001CD57532|nr:MULTISPECIES: enoyl-CoA hydratase-related protein [unclassified Saccharopolyspora]MCA1185458.1 enoyl-CoA hydratase/isomerase family protein [Saccharopolyspora sp. 6T]MCA1192319.1 enoyl-CoA hydratase/isomerase family protein [Saccharopolyspora sp. 6V]MCA1225201.1 enoyl-CoA hydratase/isomerase family protein [Saccharopolyspora sp. 6M]MCA1279560.1 enoyl-CoA hydratase/isomerase family protein [Saccharopolyspora sp. 7B]
MSDVLLTRDTGGVRLITLNRPESFNALNVELKLALVGALREAAADDAVRAVVLTGSGRSFCAGQDLKEHIAQLQADDPSPLKTVEEHYNPLIRAVATMPKPIISAVNGSAAGAGASLAFASDLRIAAADAKFLMAFANVGLSTDSGASWTLPRLIGYGRAMELLLLAEPVAADEALRIGMVNRVVDAGQATEAAMELAARMATGPTSAYARIKETMRAAAAEGLDEALDVEAGAQNEAGSTADHREAVAAFVEKRTPNFIGR